ncbi:hypothetical protein ACFWD7_41315 [Streptomyces mirabilis]|uniref:hypothetical protein n=1 Tax=Streptomyces mirabilis TaxID=68239 RepID=UPI0036A69946
MAVKVLDFDFAAAVAKCSGKEFGEAACTVLAACSLAYCELLLPRSIDLGSAAVPAYQQAWETVNAATASRIR